MTHLRGIIPAALAACSVAALAGCAGGVGYTGTVYTKGGYAYEEPTMVPIDDGVWVVEGRTEPVFYSSGWYWRYDNGLWYRSNTLGTGYVEVRPTYVPYGVRTVHRPTRYIRYHAPTRTRVRVAPPRTRGTVRVRRPYDRDDRYYRGRGRYEHHERFEGRHRDYDHDRGRRGWHHRH